MLGKKNKTKTSLFQLPIDGKSCVEVSLKSVERADSFFRAGNPLNSPASGESDIASSNELYCQCDVHLTWVQTNNLLLRSNLSTWIINSLQNC